MANGIMPAGTQKYLVEVEGFTGAVFALDGKVLKCPDDLYWANRKNIEELGMDDRVLKITLDGAVVYEKPQPEPEPEPDVAEELVLDESPKTNPVKRAAPKKKAAPKTE